MNQAPPNKMFDAQYRQKWPTAVQALAHLEKCSERVALLLAEHAPDSPIVVAAKAEAWRAAEDYARAEKADEQMRFQGSAKPRCQCGKVLHEEFLRCPICDRKVR